MIENPMVVDLPSEWLDPIWGLEEPPSTTKEVINEVKFWSQVGWASLPRHDQNMDGLPDHIHVEGCPECGSVWVDLVAVGFTAERTHGGRAWFDGDELKIEYDTSRLPEPFPRAARLRCVAGHCHDFDSFSGRSRKCPQPTWRTAAMAGIGMSVVAAYALATLKWARLK